MTKKIDKEIDALTEKIKENNSSVPTHKDVVCPKCKAKKGDHCKSEKGYVASSGHKERLRIVSSKQQKWHEEKKKRFDYNVDIEHQISALKQERNEIEDQENKKVRLEKFEDYIKDINPEKAEVVLELDGNIITIIESHNAICLLPGKVLEDIEMINALNKKGVDILLVIKENKVFVDKNYPLSPRY